MNDESAIETLEQLGLFKSYDELMDIVKECQHIAIRAGAPAVMAYIKVSFRPNGDLLTIDRKVTKHHLDEK